MKKHLEIKIISALTSALIILCIQNSFCQSVSSSKNISLTILNQQRIYYKKDTLKLQIQNLSAKKLWVSVGLDVFYYGKWREAFYDFKNPLSGVEEIYNLSNQKYLYLHLLVKDVPLGRSKLSPYRISIKYGGDGRLLKFRKKNFSIVNFLNR